MCALAAFISPSASDAEPCPPAREAERAPLPPPWRAAMDALLAASTAEGRPWSCSGARLSLVVLADGSADLGVEDAQGRSVHRPVPSPQDLVPMGEALLAAPLPEVTAAVPVRKPAPETRPLPPPPAASASVRPPPSPRGPRIHLDALASARYTGPTRALWAGGALRATLPFDAWAAGIWARFDAPAVTFDPQPEDFSMTEVSIGVAIERRLLSRPFEIRVGFEPSIAVVSMVGGEEPELYDGAKADLRLGLAVRGIWPLRRGFRLLVGADMEGAPGAAGSRKSRLIDPELPIVPAFTVGLTVGVGVGLL